MQEITRTFSQRLPCSFHWVWPFGYNTISKDYLVVRIFCPEACMEAQVYSLAKNSWRIIQPVDYRITAGKCNGIFFNNAFHWIGTPSTTEESGSDLASNFVIAFDTMTDEFRAVVQLHPDVAEDSCCIQLEVFDGCLCLLCNFDYEDFVKFEVWVMKDYGLRKSWVKLYTVTGFDHPYGITNTGNFITHKLYSGLYDPQDRSYRDINVQGIHNPIVNYTESLVPLC
ncbi:hypothetical protein IFM89_000857 [Coptis chinensis]|uniref:F-box associated beta-propeller type 1 domain-containing protein n=1 Tax=Coptis chinensis TaxID=261450 RepID=A0A835IKP2_9MAGN|nr:hypothetical protein IFM89_000857 [Coptis chinensis]